jgi:hypothetical protein
MPFVGKTQAKEILRAIANGSCVSKCRTIWLRKIQYAVNKSTKNPLGLTDGEKKQFKNQIEKIKAKRGKGILVKTDLVKYKVKGKKLVNKKVDSPPAKPKLSVKKYRERPSPPYPANDFCGKRKKGNDGLFYISKPNKNGICRWVKS